MTDDLLETLLDPQEGECVLCFTARAVDELGCDGTTRWAERFVAVRVPPATGTVRRMTPTGECDCAIVGERHTLVRDQLVRDVHTDELLQPDRRPTCAGVRRTSARPCRHWERVSLRSRDGPTPTREKHCAAADLRD